MSNPLTIITDIRETTVATSTVSLGAGLTTDNHVQLDHARGMSLADTRAHLGLDVQR